MGTIVNLEQYRNAIKSKAQHPAVARAVAAVTEMDEAAMQAHCQCVMEVEEAKWQEQQYEILAAEHAVEQAREFEHEEFERDLVEEMALDTESWARSEEEGWFYPDTDLS